MSEHSAPVFRYVLTEGTYAVEGIPHIGYGIALLDLGNKHGRRLAAYEDLCVRREEAEKLVALCNRVALDPIHLADAVEDFLP